MKAASIFFVLVGCLIQFPARGMIENMIKVAGVDVVFTGFNDAQTDATPDSSTVRFTLSDNPLRKCWEWRVRGWQSGSADLTAGLDVTLGTDIEVQFQKFPNGDAQGVRRICIQGADLRDFAYSDLTDTIDLKIRPIAPARTTAHPDMHTAALGIDFHYKGVPTIPIAYSPTIVLGDVFPEDIERRQHPSSQLLWGRAVRVDGIAGEPVNLNFIFGSSFAARWGLSLDDFGGYLDGEVPETGFTASMAAAPSFSINMGRVEDFKVFAVWNHNFSARDIQVGVFREAPRFIDIQMEPSGVRVFWNADTNRTYTLESRSTPDGAPSVLGTNLTGPDFLDAGAGTEAARFYRLQEE